MKKLTALMFFLICCFTVVGQQTAGVSGLLNTPSADFHADGTFVLGGNLLPEAITPDRFSYTTGNAFINITFLSFMEVAYRSTLLRIKETGDRFTNEDRSVTVRLRLLKEKRLIPAVVIGGNDVLTSEFLSIFKNEGHGNQYFGSMYGVATKHIELANNRLGFTLGYQYSRAEQFKGILAGIRFNPSFYKPLSVIVEYDAENVNVGVSTLLFNHLYLQAFVSNMNQFSAGIAYQGRLLK